MEVNKEYSFDDDQYLFKYIDIHKLIYFLYSENLFFSPLSYFDDPLEGISRKVLVDNHANNFCVNANSSEEKPHNKVLQDDEKQQHTRITWKKFSDNYLPVAGS